MGDHDQKCQCSCHHSDWPEAARDIVFILVLCLVAYWLLT